jgi:hypothetical protein
MITECSHYGNAGSGMRTIRTAGAAVVTVVIAGLATACSTASSGPAGTATPSGQSSAQSSTGSSAEAPTGLGSPGPSSSAASSAAACRTGSLRITVDNSQSDGAAGSTYYPIDFTNASTSACTLNGYPGVSFVTAADNQGAQIGQAAVRNPEFGPTAVRLAPGAEAHAWLQVGSAGNFPPSTCQPVTAHWLRVYPPGETEAGYVQQDFPACSADGAQLLTIMPVHGGKAVAGTTT